MTGLLWTRWQMKFSRWGERSFGQAVFARVNFVLVLSAKASRNLQIPACVQTLCQFCPQKHHFFCTVRKPLARQGTKNGAENSAPYMFKIFKL